MPAGDNVGVLPADQGDGLAWASCTSAPVSRQASLGGDGDHRIGGVGQLVVAVLVFGWLRHGRRLLVGHHARDRGVQGLEGRGLSSAGVWPAGAQVAASATVWWVMAAG